jgi:phosphatidylserine synthase
MVSAAKHWRQLAAAFIGVPALFGAFNLIAYAIDNRPVGSKSTAVYIVCVIAGAIAISLLPFRKTWLRIVITVAYTVAMSIALLFVSLWIGCANNNCG